MTSEENVHILLVDDQPAKLLSYETILRDLKVNLIKSSSGRDALEQLLKKEIALVLVDVCMPELDGFQLAEMIRNHPRFQKLAIIFISAVHLTDIDYLRGYEMGAVDYVSVPVIPEILRAKVRVFVELYRKTRQLEELNRDLEGRVAERTAQLESYALRLLESERRRTLALNAGQMGSWDWDLTNGDCIWDEGQYRIFGADPTSFKISVDNIRPLVDNADWELMRQVYDRISEHPQGYQLEFRVRRPNGETRWCIGTAAPTLDAWRRPVRIGGVTVDITERKDAEERQVLLAREVDHRAKNTLAVIQSIVRLTRADDVPSYIAALDGRLASLSRAHTLLSESRWQGADLSLLLAEEFAPYCLNDSERVASGGPPVSLMPPIAQAIALALHELITNSAKYGALSVATGRIEATWDFKGGNLVLHWKETGGPTVRQPTSYGFGNKIIKATIGGQLGGQVTFDWLAEGLQCVLAFPMDRRNVKQPLLKQASRSGAATGAPSLPKNDNRVLIVEDEALVAMMMHDMLVELGFSVVGPCSTAAEALSAARSETFEAAILDVNLGGQFVYPVAEELLARGVPFVFVTGYGQESIDCRFAHVSVLQKPVSKDILQSFFAVKSGRTIPSRAAAATA